MARRTKEDALETRLKILVAAEKVFFDRGVAQTTLEEVAAAAGLTRGAIYWHFKNKTDLFHVLYENARLPQQEIIDRAVALGHPDPFVLLEGAILEVFSILAHDEQRQRIFTILTCRCEYVGEMVEILDRQRDANERMRDALMRAFESAKTKGMLTPTWTPHQAATICMSFVVGIVTDWIRYGRKFDLVCEGGSNLKRLLGTFRSSNAAAGRKICRE